MEDHEMDVLTSARPLEPHSANGTWSGNPTPSNPQSVAGTSFQHASFLESRTSSQQPLQPRRHVRNGHDNKSLGRDGLPIDVSPGERSAPDHKSENTSFTETTIIPRRNLGFIQAASLMINGCLGNSFFFTTPCYVLALVRSKRICLVLWALGGIYSALGMTIFLEYGTALPFNGGGLIYLDEVFHRPRLLATIIFALWWIVFASTEGPAKSVAQTILSLASGRPASTIEVGLINFTAVVVQTVVCLMLFFARRLCFAFNTISALYKIILMFFIFVAGMVASRGPNSGFKDFNEEFPGYSSKEVLTAMVYIIECYQGWDNANYVSGEVRDYKRTLKWAGIATISLLTCLNMLVTLAFFGVSDYATLTDAQGQANSVIQFARIVFKTTRGMEIASTLSAFFSLIFVTYTTAKVKQAIAWQRLIPFWQFFGRQDLHYDSPGGALFLHWIFTLISLLTLGNLATDRRVFVSGIYAYGYQVMMVFLGIGLLRLKARMRIHENEWNPTYLKNHVTLVLVALIFVAINVVTLVMTALPKARGTIPRFYWVVTMAGIAAASVIYWAFLRLFQAPKSPAEKTALSRIGFEVYVYEEGDEIPDDMTFAMYEAALDGSRRRLKYQVSGPVGWCFRAFQGIKKDVLRYLAY